MGADRIREDVVHVFGGLSSIRSLPSGHQGRNSPLVMGGEFFGPATRVVLLPRAHFPSFAISATLDLLMPGRKQRDDIAFISSGDRFYDRMRSTEADALCYIL